jgi:hypothetical protein
MAVRIPARSGSTYFLVEARIRSDPYEGPSYASSGIPSEGVVVYEVAGKHEVYLRSLVALELNDTLSPEPGLEITVTDRRPGDIQVTVNRHLGANERMVPAVRFSPVTVADHAVRAAQLMPQFNGSTGVNTFVFTQAPLAGTIVAVGSTVQMTTRKGPTP